jgi:hypothetical protein
MLDNIRNNEQNKQQDNRALHDKELEQEQKNRELRDNFKDIPKFMKDKGYE